jgi:hypothetical protein
VECGKVEEVTLIYRNHRLAACSPRPSASDRGALFAPNSLPFSLFDLRRDED